MAETQLDSATNPVKRCPFGFDQPGGFFSSLFGGGGGSTSSSTPSEASHEMLVNVYLMAVCQEIQKQGGESGKASLEIRPTHRHLVGEIIKQVIDGKHATACVFNDSVDQEKAMLTFAW